MSRDISFTVCTTAVYQDTKISEISVMKLVIPPVCEVHRGYIVFAFSLCVCVCVCVCGVHFLLSMISQELLDLGF